MKKYFLSFLLIINLFVLSCNNSSTDPSVLPLGITVDPYGLTPLSAVYTTESVNTTPITVTVKGLYGEPDIIHTYPAGYGTEFEIHGMFAESDNTIIVNDGGIIITKNVNVGTLPNGIKKQYDVAINNLPEETKYPNNPELYFISDTQAGYSVIAISRNGYLRYANSSKVSYFAKIYIDNSKILFSDAGAKDNGIYDLLANKLMQYPIDNYANGYHHDFIKINNDYIYLSFSLYGFEDSISRMDNLGIKMYELSFAKLIQNAMDFTKYPEDEEVFKRIVFSEDVNNIYKDPSTEQQKLVDWFHANSLLYDSSTDILYVSSRHRGVIAIDYSEWKLIWWMADETLNTEVPLFIPYSVHLKDLKSLDSYRVKGDGQYDGPKNQHALFLLANGNLGMFDNQGDENTNPNGSRYVEYKITGTHGNYTAQKVYEYRDPMLYSRSMADVDFTGENYQNLLIMYANIGVLIEIEKDTKNVLFRLNLPSWSTYRADKMPLYYDEGRVYSEDCNLKNPN